MPNCWYQQFELLISTITIVDSSNSNCWYQQLWINANSACHTDITSPPKSLAIVIVLHCTHGLLFLAKFRPDRYILSPLQGEKPALYCGIWLNFKIWGGALVLAPLPIRTTFCTREWTYRVLFYAKFNPVGIRYYILPCTCTTMQILPILEFSEVPVPIMLHWLSFVCKSIPILYAYTL